MLKIKVHGACVSACLALMTSLVSAQPAASVVSTAAPASSSASLVSAASEAARKDNIKTVDTLVKIENSKALEESKKAVENIGFKSSGLTQGDGKVVVPPPPPATLTVESISGINGELFVDLTYSGMVYERVRLGSRVGPCEIKSIDGPRVTMAVAASTSKKKVAAERCPSGRWTGIAAPIVDLPSISGFRSMPLPQGSPMPFPAASPMGQSARVGMTSTPPSLSARPEAVSR